MAPGDEPRKDRIVHAFAQPSHVPLVQAPRPAPRLRATMVGGTLVGGGLAILWVALATPFVTLITPSGTSERSILGLVAWSAALMAPAAFLLAGTARIAAVLRDLLARRPRTPLSRIADALAPDCAVVRSVPLPDGALVPELVVGPFGVAIVEEMPARGWIRNTGRTWELRAGDGSWEPCDSPLERAARHAQSLRRRFAEGDLEYVVRVHAVVVTDDPDLPRTPACAVVGVQQLAAWLASLPAQRSLDPSRRQRLVDVLGAHASTGSGGVGDRRRTHPG
jgi:hypothetical protein